MTSAFLLSVWGDERIDRLARCRAELVAAAKREFQPAPLEVACFGVENHKAAIDAGFPQAVLLDERPVIDYLGRGVRDPDLRANINYGAIMWMMKVHAMRWAMERHDEIVWLDLDCRLNRPLPDDFWDRMREGAPIQLTLVEYHRTQCPWRKEDQNVLGEGAFIYCRARCVLDWVWERYLKVPTWVDQQVFAWVIDETCGGWPGRDGYAAQGFEPHCHRLAGMSNVHAHPDPLFTTARSKKSPIKGHIERQLDRGRITREQAEAMIREKFPHIKL